MHVSKRLIPWHKKFLADRSTGCGCSAADQSWGSRQWGAAPEHAPFQRHESRRRPAQWGRAAPPAAAVTHPAVALRASRSRTALSSSPLKRQAMSCVQESNSICQLRGGVRFPFHSIIIGQRSRQGRDSSVCTCRNPLPVRTSFLPDPSR